MVFDICILTYLAHILRLSSLVVQEFTFPLVDCSVLLLVLQGYLVFCTIFHTVS
jgi:hypothetical protein